MGRGVMVGRVVAKAATVEVGVMEVVAKAVDVVDTRLETAAVVETERDVRAYNAPSYESRCRCAARSRPAAYVDSRHRDPWTPTLRLLLRRHGAEHISIHPDSCNTRS